MIISRLNSRPKLPFPGNGKGNYKMPREGKFEACIPGNHGKREFPLTPAPPVPHLSHILPFLTHLLPGFTIYNKRRNVQCEGEKVLVTDNFSPKLLFFV